MQLVIQARHFDLTESIRQHVEKRLSFFDRSHLNHVKQVLVRLSDINARQHVNTGDEPVADTSL